MRSRGACPSVITILVHERKIIFMHKKPNRSERARPDEFFVSWAELEARGGSGEEQAEAERERARSFMHVARWASWAAPKQTFRRPDGKW